MVELVKGGEIVEQRPEKGESDRQAPGGTSSHLDRRST